MRNLIDAESNDTIGTATAEQIAASDSDGTGGGIILIDGDGDVVGPQDEHQPWIPQPVRRAYVDGDPSDPYCSTCRQPALFLESVGVLHLDADGRKIYPHDDTSGHEPDLADWNNQ